MALQKQQMLKVKLEKKPIRRFTSACIRSDSVISIYNRSGFLTAALCINFMVRSLEDMAFGVPPGGGRPFGLDMIVV